MSPSPAAPAAERERWSSRLAFYFAAVGSAVGFGNVWRFPSLAYRYGGGAFFVPYVLALLFVGLPILVLEVALGQHFETGDVGVFGSMHKRLRGVGLCSIACGYMLVTYYSMLLAWTSNAFFDSFGEDNVWASDQVTGQNATDYFFGEIIGMETLGPDYRPTRMMGKNVGYSFLTWALICFCVIFGVKVAGQITYFTMGFPILLLFIFLGRAVTLDGAEDGIALYIGDADWSTLVDSPDVWPAAVGQIFFSLGITFGIMTAYGSFCKPGEPAFMNSCVVAISNSMFSFISGFAVFATLGHLALIENKDVSELQFASFGLVFGSWPVALGTLPGGEHWIRLLFVMLFLLGIDSAFSFMEAFLAVLLDTTGFERVSRKVLVVYLSLSGFLFSLIYATDAGLIFLDSIDYYINFVMLLVGGFECFAAGWVYNIEDQIAIVGKQAVGAYMVTTFGSVILACALWFGINDSDPDLALWVGFVGLVVSYAIGMVFVFFLLNKKKQEDPSNSWRNLCFALFMKNIVDLKNELSQSVGCLPIVWAFLVKHIIPPIILVLFALGADSKQFGSYSNYVDWPFQILGYLIVAFVGFLFVSSLAFPQMYNAFQRPGAEEKAEEYEEEEVAVELPSPAGEEAPKEEAAPEEEAQVVAGPTAEEQVA